MTFTFWLLLALFVSTVAVVIFYNTFTRWRMYLAGWSLMTLLVSFGALVGFAIFSRLIPDRDLVRLLYNLLISVLTGAVWFVGGVMAYERFRKPTKKDGSQHGN